MQQFISPSTQSFQTNQKCHSTAIHRNLAYLLLSSYLGAQNVYAMDRLVVEEHNSTTKCTPISLPFRQNAPLNIHEEFKRYFRADGTWHTTEQGLMLKAQGDVFIDRLLLNKNLSIFTDGTVYFEGDVNLEGDVAIQAKRILMSGKVKAKGFAYLWGDDLTIEKEFSAEKGAQFKLETLLNKGIFSTFGWGLNGTIKSFVNAGKVDFSHAKINTTTFDNKGSSVLRTRGHFLLQGDLFKNQGTIFTTGVHQLNLKNAYEDYGNLYAPTLFLLNAPRIEYFSRHNSWLREGVIAASLYLNISNNANFSLYSSEDKCFLQLSSQGDLYYGGAITQRSTSFPFAVYDDIWTCPTNRPLGRQLSSTSNHPLSKEVLSLTPWNQVRNHWESGVVFHTDGDSIALNGSVDLTAGTVRKSIKGKLETDRTHLKAGCFTGDDVKVGSKNAFLKNSEFSALSGKVSAFVSEKAHLQNTQMFGKDAAELMAKNLTMENNSLLKSLMGSAWAHASGTATVRNSEIQAQTVAGIKAENLSAADLTMDATHNQVKVQQDAEITQAHLRATQCNGVDIGGSLGFSESVMNAEKNKVSAKNLEARQNTAKGTTVFQIEKNVSIQDLSVDGTCAVSGQDIDLSGKVEGTSFYSRAKHIKNTAAVQTDEDISLVGDMIEQLGTTSAGRNSRLEATEDYVDTEKSVNVAGKKLELILKKNKGVKGKQIAPLAEVEMAVENTDEFSTLLGKLEVDRARLHLPQADLTFTHDVSIDPDLYLWAKRLDNSANFTAKGNFSTQLQTSFTNKGSMNIRGQGYFEAPDFITNRGNVSGYQGLGLKTQGLLTHKGLFSGGLGLLDIYANKIDAAAESLQERSIFLGDILSAQSETDFLADGALVRARDGTLTAGGLLSLGAYVQTFHSEHHEDSFLGLSHTTTRRTWQEALAFDAACNQSLKLYSLKGQVRGAGVNLSSSFMKIHGEQGICLQDLRLMRTEKVEKKRFCFEIGGFDLINPFEDGIPIPKPSVEVGGRIQTTTTHQSYGVLGNIATNHLELSTGTNAEANLQGSHLEAGNLVTNTPSLKLGGSAFETSVEDSVFKATGGIAYVGVVVPTGSVSYRTSQNGMSGVQSANVNIGHIENQYEGMQLHIANGIQGGIRSGSGENFNANIDHTQTVVSQEGWSVRGSFTGSNVSLNGGANWGSKRSSDGTSFDIINTPNLIQRIDQRHEDSDNRGGINVNLGISLNPSGSTSALRSVGVSVQVKDQNFSVNSQMFSHDQSSASSEASWFGSSVATANDVLGNARDITSVASNITSAAALGGADVQGIQNVLNDINSGLSKASYALEGIERASQIFNDLRSLATVSEDASSDASFQNDDRVGEDDTQEIPLPSVNLDASAHNEQDPETLEEKIAARESGLPNEHKGKFSENELKNQQDSGLSDMPREEALAPLVENKIEDKECQPAQPANDDQQQNKKPIDAKKKDKKIAPNNKIHRENSITKENLTEDTSVTPLREAKDSKEDPFMARMIAHRKAQLQKEGKEWGVEEEAKVRKEFKAELRGAEQVTWHEDVLTGGVNIVRKAVTHGVKEAGSYIVKKAAEFVKDTVREEIQERIVGDSCANAGQFVEEQARNHGASDKLAKGMGLATEQACNFAASTALSKARNSDHVTSQPGRKVTSEMHDSKVQSTPPNASSTSNYSSTLADESSFKKSTKIDYQGRGHISYKDVEARGVRDLSHMSTEDLEHMRKNGTAPYDSKGNKLHLHHHQQKDHRDEGNFLVQVPSPYRVNLKSW